MAEELWRELLLVLAAPLLAAAVSALKSIFNNSPSPTKRRYWETELPARVELATNQEVGSALKKKLVRRAEVALDYLDADEAIRRARVPGSAPQWALAVSSYLLALGINLQISTDNWSPYAYFIAVPFLLIGAWAQVYAIQTPVRRQELLRVLVEFEHIAAGYNILLRSPERVIALWIKKRKKISRQVSNVRGKQPGGVTYQDLAEELYMLHESRAVRVSKNRSRVRTLVPKQK